MRLRISGNWYLSGAAVTALALAYLPDGGEGASVIAPDAGRHAGMASPQLNVPDALIRVQQSSQDSHVDLERLKKLKAKDGKRAPIANAFNSKSWHVAPPPPPPPVPTAPPIPFTYLGHYEDQQKSVVMLAKGDKVYTVSAGEVIDGTYRVERVTDETVEFIYLPLNISQSITRATADNRQRR